MERWNSAVAPDDTVWHLGDFAVRVRADRAGALLAGLNGAKHLIAGNNDAPEVRALGGWASVRDYAELDLGRRLVLCHYPLRAACNAHLTPGPRCPRGPLDFSHFSPKPTPGTVEIWLSSS